MTASEPSSQVAAGFTPPPYPYDVVAELVGLAEPLPGGPVDCSVGTPCDPPPAAVVRALSVSGTERGYPSSAGALALRRAAADWSERRFEVALDPADLAACVGTKEFVATAAHWLHLRNPARDTVLFPAISYPTYAMSAALAGLRAVPYLPGHLDAVAPDEVARALLLWANSPSNPTGELDDLLALAAWGRDHDIPIFSDECYTEFTWAGPPRTILQAGVEGVVAVHSLSKRSNMAGLRVGFFAGDPDLVAYLRLVRQHAGAMVPGPVQTAAAVALADDTHVVAQRDLYWERLGFLAETLASAGLAAALPSGGFYLWVPVPTDRWGSSGDLARVLASTLGLIASPGDLYLAPGYEAPTPHLRVAVVQPIHRLRLVADRLVACGGVLPDALG